MNMDPTVKIVIPSEVLVKHLSTLQRLDASAVQPAEKFGMNARLYYVFETGDQKVLEVVMQQFIGDDDAFGTFVNGIQVKKNTIFYEIILPFLTEEDRSNLGLSARSNDTDAKEFFFG